MSFTRQVISVLGAILLLASSAFGAWPHDTVCSVFCPFQQKHEDGSIGSGGSATLLAIDAKSGHGFLLSAWHIYDEPDQDRNTILVKFPTQKNKVWQAKILGKNEKYDLVALDIKDAPKLKLPAAIIEGRQQDGPFTAVGYPYNANNELRWVSGKFIGYPHGGESSSQSSMLWTTNPVISGYSGGARFNRYGEYVGLISGVRGEDEDHMDTCWGASGSVLKQFVGQWVKDVK